MRITRVVSVLAGLTLRRLLLACACLAFSPACSWLFVKSPPPQHVDLKYFGDCTSSKAAPVVDTVVAGLETLRTVYALSAENSAYDHLPISRGADIALGLGLTALFTASAVYGYGNTAECAHAQEELQERLTQEPRAPSSFPLNPYAPGMRPPNPALPMRCAYDTQCKGDRICQDGVCVGPNPPTGPSPPAAPSSAAPPQPAEAPAPDSTPPPATAPLEPPPTQPPNSP
jgi:hypothetical protein